MKENIWSNDLNSLGKYIPNYIISWLQYNKCITLYCKEKGLKYKLELIEQIINEKEKSLMRKTISYIDNSPAIIAITRIPHQSYQQFKYILDNLHEKPIGEHLLFKEGSKRSPFTFTVLNAATQDIASRIYNYTNNSIYIFARKSTFTINSYNIELQENFLPSISKAAPIC